MKITFVNAQNDNGAFAPHVVRLWQGSALIKEYYARPDQTGVYTTSGEMVIPDGIYDFEIINPNRFESRIQVILLFYNPNNGFLEEEVQPPRREVYACESTRFTIDGSVIVNLKVETGNYGTNVNNVLYTVVGTAPLTSGNDLDGNVIAAGASIPSVLTFKKIADNSISAMTLPNKKFWRTLEGLVDASAYVPYIAATAGTGSVALPAPTVSATTKFDNESVVFGGMAQGDILSIFADGTQINWAYANGGNVPANGQITLNLAGFGGYGIKGQYARNGVNSPFSANVAVTVNPNTPTQLSALTFTSFSGRVGYYVSEKIDITGMVSGATLNITLGNGTVASVLNTDYSIDTIVGGYRVTFLTANIFHFRQTKSGFTASTDVAVTVLQTRPVLAVPTPSVSSVLLNGTLTITNKLAVGYSNILVFKNNLLVVESQGDYSLLNDVYTLLTVGRYTFVGQKANIEDSLPSSSVIVSLNQAEDTYTITVGNICGVLPGNIQTGTSAINDVSTVLDWADGLVIIKNLSTNTRSNFAWIRDKTNTAVVSPTAFTITT